MATLDTTESTERPTRGAEWLVPSSALNKFAGNSQSYLKGNSRQAERTRYGVRVGRLGILILEHSLSEVIENAPIYPLPNTPKWLVGLMNLRGNMVPVFDLRDLCAFPVPENDSPFILVLDKGTQAAAILIDTLPLTLRALRNLSEMPPVPADLSAHAAVAYLQDDDVWVDLDHRSLFQSLAARIAA